MSGAEEPKVDSRETGKTTTILHWIVHFKRIGLETTKPVCIYSEKRSD